jgi:hypothetical protein
VTDNPNALLPLLLTLSICFCHEIATYPIDLLSIATRLPPILPQLFKSHQLDDNTMSLIVSSINDIVLSF